MNKVQLREGIKAAQHAINTLNGTSPYPNGFIDAVAASLLIGNSLGAVAVKIAKDGITIPLDVTTNTPSSNVIYAEESPPATPPEEASLPGKSLVPGSSLIHLPSRPLIPSLQKRYKSPGPTNFLSGFRTPAEQKFARSYRLFQEKEQQQKAEKAKQSAVQPFIGRLQLTNEPSEEQETATQATEKVASNILQLTKQGGGRRRTAHRNQKRRRASTRKQSRRA